MKEEIKNNALNDEELKEASGGLRGPTIMWCEDCQKYVVVGSNGQATCPDCGGSNVYCRGSNVSK